MRRNVLYKPIIKEFSEYPSTIIYWPVEASNTAKLCSGNGVFVFGVAGKFTEKFCIPHEYTIQDLISYLLGILINGHLIPLYQILTEENSETIFKRFLTEILRDQFRFPKKMVIEHLNFLCQAVTQTFSTNKSYEDYLTHSFECLELKEENNRNSLLDCYLVIDIRSVVANIERWDFTEYRSPACKSFMIKVVILMSQSSSLEAFENILYKILMLTGSRYETTVTSTNSAANQILFLQLNVNIMSQSYQPLNKRPLILESVFL